MSTPPTTPQTAHSRAIAFMLLSVTAFSLMDAAAKQLGTQVHVSQILWARYGGQLVILLMIFGPRLRHYAKTEHPKLQLLRSLLQLLAATCFFIALKSLGLSEATAVADLNPVLITLAAAFFLGETIGLRRIAGVICALIGALIIIRPGTDVFDIASLWPLGTAVCLSFYAIITRYIGPKESPITALFYSGLVCTTVLTLIVPFTWVPLRISSFFLMSGIGVIGIFAQWMMIKAYSQTQASAVAPFTYAGLISATFWGFLFFGTIPDIWTCVGALVIVIAGVYIWYRETRSAG